MQHENTFRLAAVAVIALIVPIAFYHRLRAHRAGGSVSRREEGMSLMVTLRLFGLAGWLVLMGYLIAPQGVAFAQWPLPDGLRWAGLVIGVLTAPLAYWVFHTLGTNITDTVLVRERHNLVQTGPYRWVRHPLYVVFGLCFLSLTLLSANWLFAGFAAMVMILLRVRLPNEEAHLIARYGDEYRSYMQRTGRFIPRLHAPALAVAMLLAAWSGTAAEGPSADKSQYTLFKPTPRELMREMSTDRPDATESPYTVDAGHFQVEMDLVSYSHDRYNPARADIRVETIGLATMNLKVGLCNNADLQLVVSPYTRIRTDDRTTGTVTHQRGFGDLVTRLKWNLWGNDGGKTALALMPFVKFPTHHDDVGSSSVEGGLIVPLAVELPAGWGMGLMTEVDFIRDSLGGGHHAEFVNTITFARNIVGNLGGFVEFAGTVSAERGSDWVGSFNTGLTYGLTENIQLDAGVNLGLTRAADDIATFLGISWRF